MKKYYAIKIDRTAKTCHLLETVDAKDLKEARVYFGRKYINLVQIETGLSVVGQSGWKQYWEPLCS